MENGSRGTCVESTELDPTVLIKLGSIETAGYSSVLVEEKSTKSFPFFACLLLSQTERFIKTITLSWTLELN